MEIFLSALLSAVFATAAVLWAERRKDRARARNQLQQIRADIMRADRDARAYCTKAQDVVERSRPMPSYRMPTSSWALLSYLHASALLTDVERERIEDWFHYAEQMNRAMDKGFPVVARQKAERLVNPDIGGHSRTELATAAIAEALSRLG